MEEEELSFIGNVKEDDYIATGRKKLYCNEIEKNVEITMNLKRPRVCMSIYEGWRPQYSKCIGFEYCNNESCKHFEDFKIKEQK